ncbi:MAG: Ig-like domain-containing protein, partial [Chloroflexi bacterium]|nr:Ig-like domain-containing protein [Chloroflexota bacterium]
MGTFKLFSPSVRWVFPTRPKAPRLSLLLTAAIAGVILLTLLFMFLPSIVGPAHAQGPGLGNLTYSPSELFQPIGVIQSPSGHGNAAMVNGYLMVIYSTDGGGSSGDGGIEFWDVSNPRTPVLVAQHDTIDTHGLREAHGFAFSNSYPGSYMVAQAVKGIQFWDLTDPSSIALLSYLDLPGINGGDYSGVWWVFWQAPYVYVAGTGNGLYVVDATDPANPLLVNQVPTGQIGGINPGTVFAVGNLLVLMEAAAGGYATMDISDPTNPVLIQVFAGKNGYSHVFAAGKILTSGGNGDPAKMYVHDVTHDGAISYVGEVGSGLGNGGYGSYQDGFFHSGFSSKYAKFDIANLTQVGSGSSGIGGRDEDFGQVLGNLVFVGNDHPGGSALIVHQTAPDTVGPDVRWAHPQNGSVDVALSSRVGVSMSDNVEIASVTSTTFTVRPVGGFPVTGKYSVQMGLVNFAPDASLQPDTTYEVVVSGVKDLVGNVGGTWVSQFTTTSLISNVNTASGQPYEVGIFAVGQPAYIDDPYSFTSQFPAIFDGQQYIRTSNADRTGTGSGFLTFDVTTNTDVYVLYDAGASQVPSWLGDGSWSLTGDTVGNTNPVGDQVVYTKNFPAGTVSLGGNADAPMVGANSMYNVVVIGESSAASPRCTIGPPQQAQVAASVGFDTSGVSGAQPITYSWDFGDGSPPTSPATVSSATHSYSDPGRYGVVLTVENALGTSGCSAVQILHTPVTAAPASSSSSITHNGAHAFNVNPDNNTVTAISESSLAKVWEAPVGDNPRTLAQAPNGNIWVVNSDDATSSVLAPVDGSL